MPSIAQTAKAIKLREIFLCMSVMLLLESDREDCESRGLREIG
jgi:hypothetical protein